MFPIEINTIGQGQCPDETKFDSEIFCDIFSKITNSFKMQPVSMLTLQNMIKKFQVIKEALNYLNLK